MSLSVFGFKITANGQGIADGGKIEFRPPELLPGFLLKINNKYKSWALFVKPRTAVQQNYRC